MLELIAIVGGLILCFYLPHEARKVRDGWVRKSFKGPTENFRTAYVKQLGSFVWLGLVLAGVGVVLAPLAQESGEWVFKLLGAAIWLAVAGIAYHLRGKLTRLPV
jgi:hypothetical protein